MNITIHPTRLTGQITAPASKSMMQRAVAAATLSPTPCTIHNPSYSDDGKAAISLAYNLGAKTRIDQGGLHIEPNFRHTTNDLSCGESGLSSRMFTPIIALLPQKIQLNGSGSLLKRPVDFMQQPLNRLGVQFQSTNGHLPIHIQGPLQPGIINIDASMSSQFLTGLLMALPTLPADSTIHVSQLKSTPYIEMTLQLMQHFGVQVTNQNHKTFNIPGNQQYNSPSYTIEGDWSGAAFLLVAGAIAGNITITGLHSHSLQADKAILQALQQAGCNYNFNGQTISIHQQNIKAFQFDATNCPDLFPPLATLAAYANGTSYIKGIHRLTHKESNRALTLQQEFAKVNIHIALQNDQMIIHGGKPTGATINSHADHRIAMSLAIAALRATAPITITDAGCVNKSFPEFWDTLDKLQQ